VVVVASAKKCMGVITVSDVIREKAKETVEYIAAQGVQIYMATGDNEKTAHAIVARAGIENVLYNIMPGAKAEAVKTLKQKGLTAFAGDGVNDAPALTEADVGIAFASGSDVAAEAGNIVLMKNNIEDIKSAFIIGSKVYSKIKQNLFWAFIYNIIGIPLAAFGYLNPMIAGTAMALSSVSVVVSSLLLKRIKVS
jgi:P-type Cu+ transporter